LFNLCVETLLQPPHYSCLPSAPLVLSIDTMRAEPPQITKKGSVM